MRSITTWIFDPSEPLDLCRRYADCEGTVLLYSGGNHDTACSSFLCLLPEDKVSLKAEKGCWEALEKKLGLFEEILPIPKWVGYFGYELGCFADYEKQIPFVPSSLPDAVFYKPSVIIHFDHRKNSATLYGSNPELLNREYPRFPLSPFKLAFRSDSLESYEEKIATIKAEIARGNVYQVNLSQEFFLEGKNDPFSLFHKINLLNPAPFSAYMQCGDFAIVSSSPERFLSRKGNTLQTRPIKGTAPRGKSREEDQRNRGALLCSEKERSELLMITDLMRNDLGKVSLTGSVKTKEMCRIEAFSNVFHLASIIEGKSSLPSIPLIRHLFPGGSITGCPKLRAMEIIASQEKRIRGIYTGSIGYLAGNGDFDFNIAIRTLVVRPHGISVQLGGAIGSDSDPIKEFEETLYKGQTLFNVLEAHELCLL